MSKWQESEEALSRTICVRELVQQRVALGPGNGHFMSIGQVSSDAVTMQRGTCVHAAQWPTAQRFYAAAAAVYR